MPKKRRIRRFVITIEELGADQTKPDQVAHQDPPPLQTRDSEGLGWMEQQELPKRRRRRTKVDAGD